MNLEIIFEIAIIMVSAAILGTIFLYLKQPIVVAYIFIGFLLGPSGLRLFEEINYLSEISHVGVILLLFLIGLNLQPNKLISLFKKTSLLTITTSFLFLIVTTLFSLLLKFTISASLIIGLSMMFSSTVIGLKLVPTTTLHQKRTGEIMTGVLLIQDLLAIIIILILSGGKTDEPVVTFLLLFLKFVFLTGVLFIGVKWLIIPLLNRFDKIQEYTFITTLGWCLFGAESAHLLGLSYEIGAFTAGISIASSPIALAIAEHLKPLREFFLILFFFSIGAQLNLTVNGIILITAILYGCFMVLIKSFIFNKSFKICGEKKSASKELSVRLSQASEFSLLIVVAAKSNNWINDNEGVFIQIITLVTFVISTYWTVLKYPTPISNKSNLLQD